MKVTLATSVHTNHHRVNGNRFSLECFLSASISFPGRFIHGKLRLRIASRYYSHAGWMMGWLGGWLAG